MSNSLVTGAAGFIGRHLVGRLVGRGDRVRCLVRREADRSAFAGADVECLVGDISRGETLGQAVRGMDRVFHLAGRTLAFRSDEFLRDNAGGTQRLVEACASCASPPALIFVSSLAAAGPSSRDRPRVEADPPAPVSHYGQSKRAAEDALRGFAGRVPITIVRPPSVIGPGERYVLGLFRAVRRGINPVLGRSPERLSLVDVRDLVEALILAAERGRRLPPARRSGREPASGVYFVAARECPRFDELGGLIAEALGRPSPLTIRLPMTLGRCLAAAGEIAGRCRGRPVLLNLDKVREAAAGSWTCDPGLAERELGFRPEVGLPERLRQTADWYRENGWL